MNKLQLILKGIVKENPTFVLVLGMCPTLGTTKQANCNSKAVEKCPNHPEK